MNNRIVRVLFKPTESAGHSIGGIALALILAATLLPGCISIYTNTGPADARIAEARQVQPYGETIDPNIWTDGAPTGQGKSEVIRSDTFVELSRKVNPAVVSIFTSAQVKAGIQGPLGLFRIPFLDTYARSLGSGFIIHPRGFIVTNAHVIAGATEINVFLHQQKEAKPARVVGIDKVTDLALLKIPTESALPVVPKQPRQPLPAIPLARSVETGEIVVAVGNPYGLSHSLTMGVISAKERQLNPGTSRGALEDFLQTSAQINPGNSGGPLLNLRGEAVGVNTAMIARAQGIGFAVWADTVREVLPHLVRDGEVIRSTLGLKLSVEAAEQEALQGVRVSGAIPGGPGYNAGIRSGDVIVEYNGNPAQDPEEFVRWLTRLPVGSEVSLLVVRGESRLFFKLRTVRMR